MCLYSTFISEATVGTLFVVAVCTIFVNEVGKTDALFEGDCCDLWFQPN